MEEVSQSSIRPLSPVEMQLAMTMVKPLHWFFEPISFGLEEIPDERPLLFVGNHTLGGVIDAPALFYELWDKKKIFLRPLGDHIHFKVPVWRELLHLFGAVDGTRDNCSALMEAGESILVYPGGAREVAKQRGEEYQLLWGRRVGFAKLAIQHQCTIVPFASVGADDAFDIVMDANDYAQMPLGEWLRSIGVKRDHMFPVVRGIGPTPIPRPDRLYFKFGPAIDPADFGDDPEDMEACVALKDAASRAIEEGIAFLKEKQASDESRGLFWRLIDRFNNWAEKVLTEEQQKAMERAGMATPNSEATDADSRAGASEQATATPSQGEAVEVMPIQEAPSGAEAGAHTTVDETASDQASADDQARVSK